MQSKYPLEMQGSLAEAVQRLEEPYLQGNRGMRRNHRGDENAKARENDHL
jgi:hypothetical protein